MSERLTPKQVRERYPDQWVALTDVDFKPGSNQISTPLSLCVE